MRGSSLRSLAYSDRAWPYDSKFTTGSLVQQVNRGSRKWSTDLYTKVYFILLSFAMLPNQSIAEYVVIRFVVVYILK